MRPSASQSAMRAAVRHVDLPEVARPVGLHGALVQAEVGGSAYYGVVVALVKRM